MRKTAKVALGTGAALVLALGVGLPAQADVQPGPQDITGVGSDTVQFVSDFVDDGYNATGTALSGYNSTPRIYRLFSFDATADAAGRAQYGATGRTSSGPFPSGIVLRAGGFPFYRAQGSGDGIKDLLNDSTAPFRINFARSSRLPTAAEQSSAAGVGGLNVFKIATDGLDLGVNHVAGRVSVGGDPLTCVPDDGLTVTELVNIYKGTWKVFGDITNYAARKPSAGSCATEPIAPLTPDASKSGTGKDFKGDLDAANGSAVTYDPTRVVFVEEHDPAAISFTGTNKLPDNTTYGPQDAVAPFSTGRYNLIQKGYFDHTLDIHAPGTSPVFKDTIALLQAGVSGVGASSYHKNRTLFIVVRGNDYSATVAGGAPSFLPGGTQTWVETFFKGTTSWYEKASNAGLYTAAGVTQVPAAQQDLGQVSAG